MAKLRDKTQASGRQRSAPAQQPTRGETRLLYVVVFCCGTALMALQIAGSRIIAPFFGMNIFTWGSLIGVFMLALALGYYVGGRMADRWPSMILLGAIVLFAGLFTLLIPLLGHPVCASLQGLGSRGGPLLACLLLFGLPSFLLGMVSPLGVRLSTRRVGTVGNVAGRLYALSTVGGLNGTMGTAFFLIPAFGTRSIIYGIGLSLVVIGIGTTALVFMLRGQSWKDAPRNGRTSAGLALALALLLGCLAYPAGAGVGVRSAWGGLSTGDILGPEAIIYHEDSAYHLILVTEQDVWKDDRFRRRRLLRFNNRTESAIYIPVLHYRIDATGNGKASATSKTRVAVADQRGAVHVLQGVRKLITHRIRDRENLDDPLAVKEAEVTVLAFSADGRHLLAGRTDGVLRIWENEQTVHDLDAPGRSVTCAAWSPDGKRVAAGYFRAGVGKAFSVFTGVDGPRFKRQDGGLKKYGGRVNALAFSPDSEKLAAVFADGTAAVFTFTIDEKTKEKQPKLLWSKSAHADETGRFKSHVKIPGTLHTFGTGRPAAWAVCWSADGKELFTGGDNGAIRVWDADRGAPMRELSVGDRRVYDLRLTRSGDLLACVGAEVWRFRAADGEPETVMRPLASDGPAPPAATSTAEGADGVIFVARADRSVYSVAADGKQVRVFPTDALPGDPLPFESAVDYTRLLHLGLIFNPPAAGKRVLVVGGGGGIAPREFAEHYEMKVEVAEIDGRVEDISLREDVGFGLRPWLAPRDVVESGKVFFHIGDARETLKRQKPQTYDYIILDAYSSGGEIPFHLMTKEFLALVLSRLTKDGVAISNVISALDGKHSALYHAEYKTFYAAGFKQVYSFPRTTSDLSLRDEPLNIILVATQDAAQLTLEQIEQTASDLVRRRLNNRPVVRVRGFEAFAAKYQLQEYRLGGQYPENLEVRIRAKWDPHPILTDDFAPVETMYFD